MQIVGWSPRLGVVLNRSWRIAPINLAAVSLVSNPPSSLLPRAKSRLLERMFQHMSVSPLDLESTLKDGRSDWLIEKFTVCLGWSMCWEFRASGVTPLLTERSPSISENRVDRLQRVVFSAAKQCQRLHEMTLNPPVKVCALLPIVAQSKLSFVAVAEAIPVLSALAMSRREPAGSIIIGSEGDFTEKEVELITEAGATAVGLGPHLLRGETATVALLATSMLWSDSQHLSDP